MFDSVYYYIKRSETYTIPLLLKMLPKFLSCQFVQRQDKFVPQNFSKSNYFTQSKETIPHIINAANNSDPSRPNNPASCSQLGRIGVVKNQILSFGDLVPHANLFSLHAELFHRNENLAAS